MKLALPSTALTSVLAALTAWFTLLAWSGFAEKPSGFLVPTLGGCLLIAAVGALLRSVRVPAVVVALGQVAAVLLWLDHRWAEDLALGGWIPTPTSVQQMWWTLQASVDAAQAYAAPVPESVPQLYPLLIATGAGVAVLVDFLAVGLRRVPLAGLPLLALYTAPISILDGGVSWLKFAIAAVTFLFLMASDEAQRLAQWGRQLPDSATFDSQSTQVRTQAVWSSARKIGFATTGLAVVAPLLVPTLSQGMFQGSGDGPGNGQGDTVSISNPMADLRRDLDRGEDIDLLRIDTPGPVPAYLRVSVLDTFDGEAWRPSPRDIPVSHRADGLLPQPPGLDPDVERTEVPYDISISGSFKSRWLPTPYPLRSIDANGDWRYDSKTVDFISAADDQTTVGLNYSLRALNVTATAGRLANAEPAPGTVFEAFTALPDDLPDLVPTLAEEVSQGAESRFEQAVRLQDWFRDEDNFTYTLERSEGNGLSELVAFLGTGPDSRRGYCEQFAAAMALMGRTLGIPSRVAVGFLRPDTVGPESYVYSSHDLHSWPEMYFQGTGWVRFEPTPQTRTDSVPAYTRQEVPEQQPTAAESSAAPTAQPNRVDQPTATPAAASGGGGNDKGGLGQTPIFIVVLLGALALAAAPRLLASAVRRSRWEKVGDSAAVAELAWRELRDTASDLRLGWDDRLTLRTQARHLVGSFGREPQEGEALTRSRLRGAEADPEATQALDRLVRLVERARFARTVDTSADDTGSVKQDVALCTNALATGAKRQQRLRATWLPTSWVKGVKPQNRRGPVRGHKPLLAEPGIDRAV